MDTVLIRVEVCVVIFVSLELVSHNIVFELTSMPFF